jgi:EAL and modified HD-GYP domain-containing signal transduction protein
MHLPVESTAFLEGESSGAAFSPVARGCISRQAILDRRGQVFGYELLFHQPCPKAGSLEKNSAAFTMSDTLALFGMDRFTGGSPAFVPCTEELLIQQLVAHLPPLLTVLEIAKDLELSPPLLHACRELKRAGFRFALADFESHHVQHPLLELADFVKVSAANFEAAEWDRLAGC